MLCLLLLAPTTLVPIISEVGAERRMYLPSLVLVSAMLVYAWQVIPRKILIAVSALLIAALAMISMKRNDEYSSTYEMWRTVVDWRPRGRAPESRSRQMDRGNRRGSVLWKAVSTYQMLSIRVAAALPGTPRCGSHLAPRELPAREADTLSGRGGEATPDQELDRPGHPGKRGRAPVQAHEAFVQALRLDPNNPDLRRNVAISAKTISNLKGRLMIN